MTKKLSVLLFYCSIVLLLGCAMISKKDRIEGPPALLAPQAILRFGDIPVPEGFKLLANNSYSFESAGFRTGVLRYQGKATPEQVINFYKEQMPMYNWDLLNVIEYGERLMNLDRDSETCDIRLLTKGKSVLITISVGPKPQIPKKLDRPVK